MKQQPQPDEAGVLAYLDREVAARLADFQDPRFASSSVMAVYKSPCTSAAPVT